MMYLTWTNTIEFIKIEICELLRLSSSGVKITKEKPEQKF